MFSLSRLFRRSLASPRRKPYATARRRRAFFEPLEERRVLAVTDLATVNSSGVISNGNSFEHDISGDGQQVAIFSTATTLVAGVSSIGHVFLKNMQTGGVQLVSQSVGGVVGNGQSRLPSMTPDAQFVAFDSFASNLIASDTNGSRDIYVKNLQTGAVTLASASATGVAANGASQTAKISEDGTLVAFVSAASNLVPDDTNGAVDVFVKNIVTGAIVRASTTSGGLQGAGDTSTSFVSLSLSRNGRYVAFTSSASDLVSGDTNGKQDVFVKDLQTGTLVRASQSVAGVQGNDSSTQPSLSDSGRYLSFSSSASNLVAGDTNSRGDIFRLDFQTGQLSLVSVSEASAQGNDDSFQSAINGDGRFITFASSASNLVAGDANAIRDVFVKDMQTGRVTLASVHTNGTQANGLSTSPAISQSSRFVTYFSQATNLVAGDTNALADIYRSEFNLGPTANPDSESTAEDTPVTITVLANDSDPENDSLTVTIDTQPTNGTVVVEANGQITYTPAENFVGNDSFLYSITDGLEPNEIALVEIEVTEVNDVPVAEPAGYFTYIDAPVNILLVANDVEGDDLNYSVTQDPAHGTLSGTAPNLIYTPNPGFTGSDAFYFEVEDINLGFSFEALITVEVLAARPIITLDAASQVVDEDVGSVFVTATVDVASPIDLLVPVALSGSATPVADFNEAGGILIRAGELTGSAVVAVIDDRRFENGAETIVLTPVPQAHYELAGPTTHEITVNDNDAMPSVSFATHSQIGSEGTGVMLVALLSGESDQPITVPLVFSGSAELADYNPPTSLTFTPGQTTASESMPIEDDTTGELAELIVIDLGTPVGASLSADPNAPLTQIITIPQNDAPAISFSGSYRRVSESAGFEQLRVTLSNLATEAITIPFSVSGNSDSADRTILTSSPLVIGAGELSATIDVQILDDGVNEPGVGELVQLTLGTPTSGSAILGGNTRYTVQIEDNDTPIAYFSAVSDVDPWENAGSITYTVRLSLPSTGTIVVPIAISGTGSIPDGYAKRGSTGDFTASTAALTFDPGETVQTRAITILNDQSNESHEKILLTLQAPTSGEAVLSGTSSRPYKQTILIKDNDPLVTVRADDVNITEANADFNFIVSLSAATNVAVTVPLSWEGTATRGKDYTISSSVVNSVTIPAGQKSVSIDTNVKEDALDEPTESIRLRVKEPSGEARLGSAVTDTVNIQDDDSPPTIEWASSIGRRSEGGASVKVTLELTKPSGRDVEVDLDFLRTASVVRDTEAVRRIGSIVLNPRDFGVSLGLNGIVTIPAGQTKASFYLYLYDDNRYEGNEVVQFYIADAENAKLPSAANRSLYLTIVDDESPPAPPAPTVTSSSYNNFGSFGSTGSLAIQTSLSVESGALVELGSPGAYNSPVAVDTTSGAYNYASPFTIALSYSGNSTAGLYNGATVFFDANLNGVRDYLDLNGNGEFDEEDLEEPGSVTALDGAFSGELSSAFDVNADGQISSDEGRWVMAGGVDTSIGLTSVTRLASPLAQPIITPLSTVVEALMRLEGLTYADANERVGSAFNLGGAGFAEINPVHGAVNENGLATEIERQSVKLSSAVLQIASLFAGVPGAPPIDFLADAVYAEIANRIAAEGAQINLSLQPALVDLIGGVSARTGVLLDASPATAADLAEGAAEIIAAGNSRMDVLSNDGTLAFLTDLFRIKKVMQVDAAPALQAVTSGDQTLSTMVYQFTDSNLDDRIAAATLGQLIPPAISINNNGIVEGASGQQMLEFTVTLVGDHTLPASVEYYTGDDTAAFDEDYLEVAGLLEWEPGDNTPRTIQVPVLGDNVFEADEAFRVFLSNATNAVVRNGLGFGFILNDETLDITPAANGNSALHTLAIDAGGFERLLDGNRVQGGQHAQPLVATIQGLDDVDDTFRLDVSGSAYRADQLTFNGGGGTGFDTVEIVGGNFQTITQKLMNATDGQTILAAEGQPLVTLDWLGMEPFVINVGSVDEMIFELPAGVTDAVLEDADPTDTLLPGILRLRSPSGAFETTDFPNPAVSIVIRGGDGADELTIGDLDPGFLGTIRVDTTALGTDGTTVAYTGWTLTDPQIIGGVNYRVLTKGVDPDIVTLQIQDDVRIEFSVADASDSEATGGNLPKLLVKGVVSTEQTIDVTITGGSATSGDDFTLTTTVTIPAGSYDGTLTTAIDIPLSIVNDEIVEAAETIELALANPSSGLSIDDADGETSTQSTHTYTITDDDATTVSIAATDDTATEAGLTSGTFTVALAGGKVAPAGGIVVNFSVAGSANAGDYSSIGTSVTILEGDSSATITVTPSHDYLIEPTESVLVTLSSTDNANASVGDPATATVNIQDDDNLIVEFNQATGSGAETAGTGMPKFLVSGEIQTGHSVTINVVAGGTATSADYTVPTTTTITAGSYTETAVAIASLAITPDTLIEPSETITLGTITGSAVTVGTQASTTYTINDDDNLLVEFNQATGSDAETSGGNLPKFLVTGTIQTGHSVTINVVPGGTATASDYTAPTTTTVTAGSYSATAVAIASLAITPDTLIEPNETITLGTITGSAVNVGTQASTTYTINDDDNLTVEFNQATGSGAETAGTGLPKFLVTGNIQSGHSVTINVVPGGTATASDYTAPTTTTVGAGTYTATAVAIASLAITPDSLIEPSETITLGTITGSAVTVGTQASTTYTINDDDNLTVEFNQATGSDVEASGGNLPKFLVTGTIQTGHSVTINVVPGGTATASDYTAPTTTTVTSGTYAATAVSIASLAITPDSLIEPNETITLGTITGSAVTVGTQASTTYTINDDDNLLVEFNQATGSGAETAGTGLPKFLVTGNIQSGHSVTINTAVTGGSAIAADFAAPTTTTVTSGGYSATAVAIASLAITPESLVEGSETIDLGTITGSAISLGTQTSTTYTILDDDAATVSIAATTSSSEPTLVGKFTVTQTNPSSTPTVLTYAVQVTSTATAGVDYEILSGTVTIPALATTAEIDVTAINDFYVEGTETVVVTLTGITSGDPEVTLTPTIANRTATLNLLDDDVIGVVPPAGTTQLLPDPASPGNNLLVIVGTTKNDTLIVEPSSNPTGQLAVKRSGKPTLLFPANVSRIVMFGLAGNDTLRVDSRINVVAQLFGDAGNDSLSGGGGPDSLDGGIGNDTLRGGGGNDLLSDLSGSNSLYGENGDDQLTAGTGSDKLYGGSGNDVLTDLGGTNSLYGESGHDLLTAGAGNDKLYGGIGNDFLRAGGGKDYLNGDSDDDILLGDAGDDSLYGGSGRDLLIGGLGKDSLRGESGEDLLIADTTWFDASDASLNLIRTEWTATDRDYSARVANLQTAAGPVLTGTGVKLTRTGTPTVLDETSSKDTLNGGSDRDWYFFQLGIDKLEDLQSGEVIN